MTISPYRKKIAEMAQAMLSNATIARRLNIRPKTVRNHLSAARTAGASIPSNAARVAHEDAHRGLRLSPLSTVEIARLERAGKVRGVTASVILDRIIREVLSPGNFPALIDNILDDELTS